MDQEAALSNGPKMYLGFGWKWTGFGWWHLKPSIDRVCVKARYVMSKQSAKKKSEASSDVYDKLKADHREVEKLFKTLINSEEDERKKREENFLKLKDLLAAHADAEEEIFYPLTEKDDSSKELTLEAYEEHKIAKKLLDEISELQTDDETWTAKVKVLAEVVKHHVKEEEEELFPLAKKVISKDEAVDLAQEIEDFEQAELSN
jgi:hemerythrin superfamily protein